MKCSNCSKKAVVELRYRDKAFCKNCFKKNLETRVFEFIKDENLVRKGEEVAVAVSGGKDSLTTLYLLNKFKEELGIELKAITINEGTKYRTETVKFIEKQAEDWGVDYELFTFKKEFGFTLEEMASQMPDRWSVCHYCGTLRRYLLNKKARELGFNKLATGHNLDDEAQSILMNCFMGDNKRMARLGPTSGYLKSELFVKRVKPLRMISERETTAYALISNIETSYESCPNVSASFRDFVQDLLNEYEYKHPGTKLNLVKSIDKLNFKKPEIEIKECKKCGEPTSKEVCSACKLLKELK